MAIYMKYVPQKVGHISALTPLQMLVAQMQEVPQVLLFKMQEGQSSGLPQVSKAQDCEGVNTNPSEGFFFFF